MQDHSYWLSGYILWLQAQGFSAETVKKYRYYVFRFLQSLSGDITRQAITLHMVGLTGRSASYRSVNYHAIKAFLRYLREEESLEVPAMPGKAPKAPLPPVDVPSEDDIKALIKACQRPLGKGDDKRSRRDHALRDEAIIRLLAGTGMRLSECAGIKVADIDLGSMPRVKVMGKGGRPRYVPLTPKMALTLRRYIRQREKHPYAASPYLWLGRQGRLLPNTIYNLVRDTGHAAGVDIHPHQLRHAYCHAFQDRGGQVNELAELVGWTDLSMAMRYARATLGDRAEERARSLAIGDRL